MEDIVIRKYDVAELLRNPDSPLTKEQYENLDKYLRPTNDDKSAKNVDIGGAVDELIAEMDENGSYWW
jgi:hypothetical protein